MPKKLLTQEDCDKFNKVLNTETNRCNIKKAVKAAKAAKAVKAEKPAKAVKAVKPAKAVKAEKPAKAVKAEIVKKVKPKIAKIKKILTEEDCFKINKILNPETNRCNIKKAVKAVKAQIDINTPIRSLVKSRTPMDSSSYRTPMGSIKSITPIDMSASRKKKLDEFVKKRAKRIIQKLTTPFTNRVSANIDDRVVTYNLYYKYLSKHDKEQCLKVTKNTLSLLNDNVKIIKQIEEGFNESAILLSKGTNTGELFRFASKIMSINANNLNEINIVENLTKMVIAKKNPHFPIMYYNFICNKQISNQALPNIADNKTYYITLNELANGNAKTFVHKYYGDDEKMQNAIVQIIIAIYSFHCEGYFHNNTQWHNFLFHKIKPGGYIKYVINGNELYLKNIGFLWVILDFGLATKITKKDSRNMRICTQDYRQILRAFRNKNAAGDLQDDYPISNQITNFSRAVVGMIETLIDEYPSPPKAYEMFMDDFTLHFKQQIQFFDNIFIYKEDLPANAVIVNKVHPYIIGQ